MTKNLFSFIWQFLRQHKFNLSVMIIVTFIASLEIALGPYILKLIIDAANTNNNATLLSAIFYPALFYVLLTVIHNIAFRTYDYSCIKFFPKLRTEISTSLFNYLSQHSIIYFQQNFSGDLANKISNMSEGTETIVKITYEMILGRILTIIIGAILLCTVHFIFPLILLVWVILYVANGYRFTRKTAEYARAFSQASSRTIGEITDSISNIVSAKIFSNTDYESSQVEESVNAVGKKEIILQEYIMKIHFYQNILFTFLIIFLMCGLVYGRLHDWVTVGDFAFILGLSIAIAGMVNGLTQAMPTLAKEMGKCQQTLNVIVTPHEIQDIKNPKTLSVTKGLIEFKNVVFGYDKKILFNNLNVVIEPGTKVGLVGFSGSGKTTFINLLLRLYDINKGDICIDEQNIKLVTRDSLISNIALIPQHPELFHRSMMDNIRYGDIKASDQEIYAAAKIANCNEFIEQLDNGYQSLVGERGIKLSGGQRQRIAIARAVLKNSPILILDEATSALDSFTEKQIQDSFNKVMLNKTSIVIAHRLATALKMDRILFFKDGAIVEEGTVKELLAKQGGYFSKFWEMQTEGFIP